MNEETKRLLTALTDNKELETKLEEACDRIFNEGKVASENEAYVAAAKELGYQVPLEDMEKITEENQELDEAALDEVAGGRRKLRRRKRHIYSPGFDENANAEDDYN